MKKIFAILGLVIYSGILKAQAPEFNDLRILYADANYEKLIREATKYTQKDDTKSSPVPFLWLSKGLYQISLVGDRPDVYKNAYKESITAFGSFRKKDKDSSLYKENIEYFEILKNSLIEIVLGEVERKDYKKAVGWIPRIYKLSPDDAGAKYLEGACKFRGADKGGANLAWKEAEKKLAGITSLKGWTEPEQELLMVGVIETAECFVATKQLEKAKDVMNKIAQWYGNNEEFQKKYNEIVN